MRTGGLTSKKIGLGTKVRQLKEPSSIDTQRNQSSPLFSGKGEKILLNHRKKRNGNEAESLLFYAKSEKIGKAFWEGVQAKLGGSFSRLEIKEGRWTLQRRWKKGKRRHGGLRKKDSEEKITEYTRARDSRGKREDTGKSHWGFSSTLREDRCVGGPHNLSKKTPEEE